MAGHSKWKNIQHRKGSQDKKRGRIFTKIGLELQVASRTAGCDPTANPRLRNAILKARAANMSKDIIERNIQRGVSLPEGVNYQDKLYEGYGCGGVALLVQCLTDNINRTVSDVRHAFSKGGGQLGNEGSVSWMFQHCGVIIYDTKHMKSSDALQDVAITAGALDLDESENTLEIITSVQDFFQVREALQQSCPDHMLEAQITWIAENFVTLDEEYTEKLMRLLGVLEDMDDVQHVYHNGNIFDPCHLMT